MSLWEDQDSVKRAHYVTEPSNTLKCTICYAVACDPMQHVGCGNLVCRKCLEEYGKEEPCPKCKRKSEYYEDNKSKRDIQALRVRCSNNVRGCPWEGTLSLLHVHETTCQYNMVPCPKECLDYDNEVNLIMKKDLGHHVKEDCPNRTVACVHCKKTGPCKDIVEHSLSCNGSVTVICPDCEVKVYNDINEHIKNECLLATVPCKYKSIGCKRKGKRRDSFAHEQDHELHLGIALNTMVEMKEALSKLQDLSTQQKNQRKAKLVFAVTEFEARRCTDQKVTSPSFYTSYGGYRMACRVYANGDGEGKGRFVSVRASLLEGKNDNDLKWPFSGSITFTLLNQLEDRNHHSCTTSLTTDHNAVVGIDWGKPKFILHSKLYYDEAKKTQYLMDDKIYIRVSVEVADKKPWLECFAETTSIPV